MVQKVTNQASYMQKKAKRDMFAAYVFLLPTLVGFVLFIGIPIILSLIFTFCEYNFIKDPVFVGLDNIKKMISDRNVWISFANTFKFLLVLCPIHCGLGMVLAFSVYKARRLQSFFRGAIYFPTIVTTAAVAIAWGYLFATDSGAINYFIRLLGGKGIPWLTNPVMAYVTIAIFSFWKFIGTTFLYYFIGMQNIPDVYYEAARIDGATTFQSFKHITLPLLSPTTFFVLITNIVGVFQIFDEPFILTKGGPGNATRTVALQIYKTAFQDLNIGYGSAISFLLFLIILAITIVQYKMQNKWVVYDYD